jgi:[ribulose-bisphosphate carboxylase]-lysine N-methyltransferase
MSAMSALASSAPPCAARRPSSATAATSRAPPPLRRQRDGRSSSSSSSSLSARAIPTPSTSSSSAPTTSANDDARTQADFDALWTWLEREGADVASVSPALVDATPGGRGWGLVATRDVGGGDAAIVVPRALWMTKETAFASKIGTALDPETTPPWCALALQLLHEKSLGDESRWAAYIRRVLCMHWFPYDRVGVVNADP